MPMQRTSSGPTDRARGRSRSLLLGLLGILASFAVVDWGRVVEVVRQRQRGFLFFADAYVWRPGEEVERISPGNGIFYQPCIRPDGRAVAFAGATDGPPRIWIRDLETGSLRAVTPETSAALHPAYSWQGDRIAFASDRAAPGPPLEVRELEVGGEPSRAFERTFHVFTMDADGGDVRRITSRAGFDSRPAFSPDGATIVFVALPSTAKATPSLMTVPADGSAAPTLLHHGLRPYRPWYSADGRWIHFHTIGPRPHRLMRIPAEGGTAVPVVAEGFFERAHGSFVDPSGEVLWTHAFREGRWSIWEVPLEGGEPRRIEVPGFEEAFHPTRSVDGRIAFDVPVLWHTRRELSRCLRF